MAVERALDTRTVPAGAAPDLPEKLARLAVVARSRELSTLVLRDPATLGWLLGARVHVPQTLDTACLDVVVEEAATAPRLQIVTNAIEAPRLRNTELAQIDADWQVLPWWQPRDTALPTGPGVGSDRPLDGAAPIAADVAAARRPLTTYQQSGLRAVCADAAEAATAAAARVTPSTTEYQASGLLAHELLDRGLDPIVLLAAGDERIGPHRHPLPTSRPVGRRAMLVCCARRHGLVTSITRLVAFGSLTHPEQEAYAALLRVEQAFLDATKPGARLGDVFATGVRAYAAQGLPPDEWHRHHQGGFSGFQPREFPAHHHSDTLIPHGSVIAWNPSGGGWKVEDTCLVHPNGPEPLVRDSAWPSIQVGGRQRPDVLVH